MCGVLCVVFGCFSFLGFGIDVFRIRKKLYIVYVDIRLFCSYRKTEMKNNRNIEEIRWQVVKAMLDDFPALRGKVKSYIEKAEN